MKRSNKAQIKTLVAARVIIDLLKRRRDDLGIETVMALENKCERIIDCDSEGFLTLDLESFVEELTDILVDGQVAK